MACAGRGRRTGGLGRPLADDRAPGDRVAPRQRPQERVAAAARLVLARVPARGRCHGRVRVVVRALARTGRTAHQDPFETPLLKIAAASPARSMTPALAI